jgi:hypothetical protein
VNLAEAVAGYAARFHRAIEPGHGVASPLGAWLVLALAAPAALDRGRLESVLGCSIDDASSAARALVDEPHEVVRLATAAWHAVETPELSGWLAGLGGTERGPMPSQADADAWARERTGGLIERFPLTIDDDTLLVLASAVACAISWRTPFVAADAGELTLPRTPGFDAVRTVLRTPRGAAQEFIVDSPDAGLLAVHAVPSTDDDMLVVSVIADPSVAATTVLSRAHATVVALGQRRSIADARSLFDLPLGTAHSWTLTEEVTMAPHDQERFDSWLPAWSAESAHDLTELDGFADAAAGLTRLLPDDPRGHEMAARQVALARYTRTGFEAAAVTAFGVRASMAMQARESRLRTARVEYTHPYAVVAVAVADSSSPWAGLPLFSAWVARADEVADDGRA